MTSGRANARGNGRILCPAGRGLRCVSASGPEDGSRCTGHAHERGHALGTETGEKCYISRKFDPARRPGKNNRECLRNSH